MHDIAYMSSSPTYSVMLMTLRKRSVKRRFASQPIQPSTVSIHQSIMSDTNKLQQQSNEKVAGEVGAPSTEKKPEGEKKKLPQLGALEDDDEFEVCSFSFPFWPKLTIRTFQQLVCRPNY